jgi:integrase
MFLVGFAGAMRRSELVGLNVEHVTWTEEGMKCPGLLAAYRLDH